MSVGFILVRYVESKRTDLYWKEAYRSIRRFYPDAPVIIIDDSSLKTFLNEDIVLTNCTVIYDKDHRGAAEFLPFYYFHLLKPFETAIILHDSVFIQNKMNVELDENEPCRFLWTFPHQFDDEIFTEIKGLYSNLKNPERFCKLYQEKEKWRGCFGCMTIIKWDFLDHVFQKEELEKRLLPHIQTRMNRHALERVLSLIFTYYYPEVKAMFGDIFRYCRWGLTFEHYLLGAETSSLPLVKVWTSR